VKLDSEIQLKNKKYSRNRPDSPPCVRV